MGMENDYGIPENRAISSTLIYNPAMAGATVEGVEALEDAIKGADNMDITPQADKTGEAMGITL